MTPIFARSSIITAIERLVLRGGRIKRLDLNVRYGLFRHPTVGPVLIDTGYTDAAMTAPGRGLFLWLYSKLFRATLLPHGQPKAFLARHGLAPSDITRVIVTHFHADHISGLHLFENARFILNRPAFDRMQNARAHANLRHGVFPELMPRDAATRADDITQIPPVPLANGLEEGRDIFGDASLYAVDLPGHADGHFGLLFAALTPPFLYACDAQWLVAAIDPDSLPGFPASLVAVDPQGAVQTARRIAAFRAAGGTVMTCHDPGPAPFDEDVL